MRQVLDRSSTSRGWWRQHYRRGRPGRGHGPQRPPAASGDPHSLPVAGAGYRQLRQQGGSLLLDLVRPIAPPLDLAEEADAAPVGALAATIDATARLAALLEHRPTDLAGEASRLVIELPSGSTMLARSDAEERWTATPLGGRPGLGFGPSTDLVATAAVPGTDWTVVQSIDRASACASLAEFQQTARLIGLAISLAVALGCCALWWLREARHRRLLAEQYRALAERLTAANRILTAITDHAAELVGLKDAAGCTGSSIPPLPAIWRCRRRP